MYKSFINWSFLLAVISAVICLPAIDVINICAAGKFAAQKKCCIVLYFSNGYFTKKFR